MEPAAVVPEMDEAEKVRTIKQIGVALGGISPQSVRRRLAGGELVVFLEGSSHPTPVIYEDHIGYWAPKSYLDAWKRAQNRVATATRPAA